MKNKFEFGECRPDFRLGIQYEMREDIYQCIYPVRKNDIVLDIGASIGPFSWSVMDKASKIYAVEPLDELQSRLKENTVDQGYPVEIIQKVLWYDNIPVNFVDHCVIAAGEIEERECQGITFNSLLKEHNIDKIDFLKCDCEGGEYFLFRDENMDFLKNNVRDIVCEFHVGKQSEIIEFKYFLSKFLKQFPNYTIYSCDNVNIGWDLHNYENNFSGKCMVSGEILKGEDFFDRYEAFMIHISNKGEVGQNS